MTPGLGVCLTIVIESEPVLTEPLICDPRLEGWIRPRFQLVYTNCTFASSTSDDTSHGMSATSSLSLFAPHNQCPWSSSKNQNTNVAKSAFDSLPADVPEVLLVLRPCWLVCYGLSVLTDDVADRNVRGRRRSVPFEARSEQPCSTRVLRSLRLWLEFEPGTHPMRRRPGPLGHGSTKTAALREYQQK
ncbi:hypothetical protein EVAR_56868_1 [Eumeta japonica]|uniref:Uncharacterized protein n=1 Tax=Eumeta variegata TaxID=151549 RepID=A0A4C1Z8K2_EUMVA|nr:hypothetical protein EVAR_56868_1 [Eumeta japonica]